MSDFTEALRAGDLARLRRVPKGDLHNHGTLGGALDDVRRLTGRDLRRPPATLDGIHGLMAWTRQNVHPIYETLEGFEALVAAAFLQARRDGVRRLEMSIETSLLPRYPGGAGALTDAVRRKHREHAPEVEFLPELGLKRQLDPDLLLRYVEQFLETGYYRAVDLYGDELSRPPRAFQPIFRLAASQGLSLKAHVGEIGTAADVLETVEALELDAVQHGVAAARSPEVMRALAKLGIPLHVCPTSNVCLGVARSHGEHPLRELLDAGVAVTVGTDDVLLFGRGVSDEYLALFQTGRFAAEELDAVRQRSLGVELPSAQTR
ncbi:MAG: amidohydrolase family protein [Myxococcales bacterium]